MRRKKRRSSASKKKEKRINSKKNSRGKTKLIFFIIILLIILGIVLLLTLDIFDVKDIEINNLVKLKKEEVLAVSEIQKGKNIFLQKYGRTRKNIASLKMVESVEISKKLPNTIKIDLEERVEMYQIEHSGKYMIIDKQGYILRDVNTKQPLPIIELDDIKITESGRLDEASLEILENVNKIYTVAMSVGIDGLITKIHIKNIGFDIELETEKKVIEFNKYDNLKTKLEFAKEVINANENKGKKGKIFFINEKAVFSDKK